MKVISSPTQKLHKPRQIMLRGKIVTPVEQPERLDVLMHSLCGDGHQDVLTSAHALDPIFRVHDRNYVKFLREAYAEWRRLPDAGDEVLPNTHHYRNAAMAEQPS